MDSNKSLAEWINDRLNKWLAIDIYKRDELMALRDSLL